MTVEETPEAKRKLPPWLGTAGKILMFTAPLALFILVVLFYPRNNSAASPEGVSASFFSALSAHDYSKAYSLFSSSEQSRLSEDDMRAAWEKLEAAHGNPQAVQPGTATYVQETTAKVQQRLDFSGWSKQVELELQESGGRWVIDGGQPLIPTP